MFTEYEMEIINLIADFRNYNNLESELRDNAVGLYMDDITEFTDLTSKVARGVVSSLEQKDMVIIDKVNGKYFYRASDKCLEYCYNVLDKESEA